MQILAIALLATALCVSAYDFKTKYQWKYIDYHYPSEEFKNNYVKYGYYNYSNIIPNDVNLAPDGRVFVSFYGRNGSYIPLATVSKYESESGYLVEPYPSWDFYNFKFDKPYYSYEPKIYSVYRTTIDKCNRLWFFDSGYYYDDNVEKYSTPKLYAFDLNTDKLIKSYEIPAEYYKPEKYRFRKSYPAIETHGESCDKTAVYIADYTTSSLIVYDQFADKFYYYQDPTFEADQKPTDFSFGEEYYYEYKDGGLYGLTLVPAYDEYDSYFLYYRPYFSKGFYALNTTLLHAYGVEKALFFSAKNYFPEPVFGQDYSPSEETMFFGMYDSNGLGCWNRYNEKYEVEYLVKDDKRFYHPISLHVYDPFYYKNYDQELWVLSNRFTEDFYYSYDKIDFKDYNFYVLNAPIKEIVAGTKCEKSYYKH